MGVNKVTYCGETLVDMSDATIQPNTVLAGYVGYGADGNPVLGTLMPTVHKTIAVTLSKDMWDDNQQSVDVDFATADAMVIAGGEPESQEYFDCEVWCSGQDDGRLIFRCTYEPMEDVVANIGMLMTGELVISYARGSMIQLTDAAERKLRGLTIYGKTTQNGTPSPTAPVPMVSVGDGGSIAVSMAGKNLFSGWVSGRVLTSGAFIEYVSGVRTDHIPVPYGVNSFFVSGVTTDVTTMLAFYDPEKNFIGRTNATSVSALTWLAPENTAWIALTCYLTNTTEPIGDKVPQNVQIEIGRAASDYEPYKEPQTLTIQKPTDVPVFLPGIHVSEGGNYTDENGWQWVCDEVDFARGVYVQRVWRIASYAGENLSTAYMSATGSLSNGAEILYVLAAPIETPLSSEELAQYAALRTYSPNTTIYTNTEADMMVRYVKE